MRLIDRIYFKDIVSDGIYLEPTVQNIFTIKKIKPLAKNIFEPPFISTFVLVIASLELQRGHVAWLNS